MTLIVIICKMYYYNVVDCLDGLLQNYRTVNKSNRSVLLGTFWLSCDTSWHYSSPKSQPYAIKLLQLRFWCFYSVCWLKVHNLIYELHSHQLINSYDNSEKNSHHMTICLLHIENQVTVIGVNKSLIINTYSVSFSVYFRSL